MSLRKFNKGGQFDFDPTGMSYVKLADLYKQYGKDNKYQMCALWVHKSDNAEFGDTPVIALADVLVNCPSHLVSQFKDILKDEAAVQEIKDGKGFFTIYEYESHKKMCYSINFE